MPLPLTAVTPRPVARLDPMATPGITSVGEQGAPLNAGAVAEPATAAPDGADDGSSPRRPPVMTLSPGQFPAPASPAAEGLRLVTSRSLYDNGTLVQAAASLARLVPEQVLRISAGEMDRLGALEGALVRVRSRAGELVVPVAADSTLPDGLASLAFGTVPADRPGVADLIDSSASLTDVVVEAAW